MGVLSNVPLLWVLLPRLVAFWLLVRLPQLGSSVVQHMLLGMVLDIWSDLKFN